MTRHWKTYALAASLALAGLLGAPEHAEAFCGFYVSGSGESLSNQATMVSLMREGNRTVLAMENNYQGPPQDFAMVVPVPTVLKKEQVKTLSSGVFRRLDRLAAPRLVEYWEQDPCFVPPPSPPRGAVGAPAPGGMPMPTVAEKETGVKIEAKFAVGEYDIVILSATDSGGLATWLKTSGYKIPNGAAPYLKPYVLSGSKFFVAKVNLKKVRKVGGQLRLSPLRFHYSSAHFRLPVRLGLINSQGKQDLLVHILAKGQRYEAANYENVTMPTNLELKPAAKQNFAGFYNQLFDEVMAKNPKAVVTEYAWTSTTCDPCPGPPMNASDAQALGGDVLFPGQGSQGLVLTRLHTRYSKDILGEDIVFRKAAAITGGRETNHNSDHLPSQDVRPASINNFQSRYAIRHRWEGEVSCENPRFGRWGGPPQGGIARPVAATDLGYVAAANGAPGGMVLPKAPGNRGSSGAGGAPGQTRRSGGCAACTVAGPEEGSPWNWAAGIGALGLLAMRLVRRGRSKGGKQN